MLLLGLAACSRTAGCREDRATSPSSALAPKPLAVPAITAAPKLDGEPDEPEWLTAARSGAFVDSHGTSARPYSEAKFLADAEHLYLVLYAADEDIEPSDHFAVSFEGEDKARRHLEVSAKGSLSDYVETSTGGRGLGWESGFKFGVDKDGTPGQPDDDDEEWVVEGSLPRKALGLVPGRPATLRVRISRTDVPKDHQPRAGGWEAVLALP